MPQTLGAPIDPSGGGYLVQTIAHGVGFVEQSLQTTNTIGF
jgi:hypothetical protein